MQIFFHLLFTHTIVIQFEEQMMKSDGVTYILIQECQ